jgi:hypothetical protein
MQNEESLVVAEEDAAEGLDEGSLVAAPIAD